MKNIPAVTWVTLAIFFFAHGKIEDVFYLVKRPY